MSEEDFWIYLASLKKIMTSFQTLYVQFFMLLLTTCKNQESKNEKIMLNDEQQPSKLSILKPTLA